VPIRSLPRRGQARETRQGGALGGSSQPSPVLHLRGCHQKILRGFFTFTEDCNTLPGKR
jgi:hypothetical protein